MDGEVYCVTHSLRVIVGDDLTVQHRAGGFCRSERFRIEGGLSRGQAQALLLVAKGLAVLDLLEQDPVTRPGP